MPNPFEKDFEDASLKTLYRKMKKTAKARFNAARRMEHQQDFLTWSSAFFSVGLIGLSLLTAFQLRIGVSPQVHAFLQVILAILVLVVSILLSGKDFQSRAGSMHRCGLEINALCNSMLEQCKKHPNDAAMFSEANEKYSTILSAYENHHKIDNDMVEAQMRAEYGLNWFSVLIIKAKYLSCFTLYVILWAVFVAVFLCEFGIIPLLK